MTSAIGRARKVTTSASGTSTTSAQHNRAEAIRLTSWAPRRAIGAANRGTTAPARAPPAATSYSTLGIVLAVAYALPTAPARTVAACTSQRPNPRTRERTVSTAIIVAAPATPVIRRRTLTAGDPRHRYGTTPGNDR